MSPRGDRGSSGDIKGISGFKYRKTLSSILILVSSNFIETILDSVFLYLKPEMPLISPEEPLSPRGDIQDYFAPNRRPSKIII
jgi:hypothetical protein